MLGPEDVGHRVVVRRIVGIRDNRPVFSDLLGELVALTEIEITVRTASGSITVPVREIARAKRVPDERAPTATERLEPGLYRVFQPADSRAERAWPVRFRSYAARLVALAQTAAIGLFMFRGTQMYATNGYLFEGS